MINNISIHDLKKLHHINIIDLRCITNYNNGHILDAINIPYQSLVANPKKYLNFNDIYYLYCQSGITSIRVCDYLRKMGYKAINIKEGYEGWVLEN